MDGIGERGRQGVSEREKGLVNEGVNDERRDQYWDRICG